MYVAFAMPIAMLGVAWPDIRDLLSRSEAELGVLAGCYGIGRLSTAASSGVVLRALPFGPATLVLALALAASCAVVSFGPSWPVLVVAVAAVGATTGVLESLGGRFLAVSGSVRAAGLVAGSYGVGATIGPALIAVTADWRLAYVFAALATVAAGAAVATPAMRWTPSMASDAPTRTPDRTFTRRSSPSRAVIVVSLILFIIFVGAEATAGQWTATFLEESRGLDRWLAGLAVSGFFAGVTVGRLLLGAVEVPLRVLPWLAGLMVPMLAGVAVGPPHMAPAFVSLAGLALAPMFPMLMATTGQRVGVPQAGRVSGWQLIAGNMGGTAMPAMTGLVVAWTSSEAPIVMLIAAGTVGAGLLTRMSGDQASAYDVAR
jgi:fucose permease